jgi:hypothetical protein
MAKSLVGGRVKFKHRHADGSSGETVIEVKEGDVISVEREYPGGEKEERQVFPQATGYQPVKSPWKEKNDR